MNPFAAAFSGREFPTRMGVKDETMKSVWVVLVSYTNPKITLECIRSLERVRTEHETHIVVVDNASPDGAYEELEKLRSGWTLIQSGKNGGFAFGNNIGIRHALDRGADYVLLLNNDTEVQSDFLDPLVAYLENYPGVGIAAPQILYDAGRDRIWSLGGTLDTRRMVGMNGRMGEAGPVAGEPFPATFLSGCAMLIRREVFAAAGLLPEEYFMYYEDADFGYTVKKSGYLMACVPASIVYHKVSLSSGGEDSPFSIEHMTRSHRIFLRRVRERNLMKLGYIVLRKTARALLYLVEGKADKAKAIVKGWIR